MSSDNLDDNISVSPNMFIFLLYFTHKEVFCLSKPYAPQELLALISHDANAVDYIGEIQVTQMFYYKETSFPENEFLVFKVEATDRAFVNYIKIDRSLELAVSYGDQNAWDVIHVPGSEGLDSLIGNKPTLLGKIKVSTESSGQRLTLERLIVLALSVSSYEPQYGLFVAQSHWYAYTIWKLLLAAFPDTVKFDGELRGAGRNELLPMVDWHKKSFEKEKRYDDAAQVTEIHRHAKLAVSYLKSWGEFEQKIPTLQAKYGLKIKYAPLEETRAKARRDEEETKRIKEETKRFKEETQRIEANKRLEENKRREEETKRLQEENKRFEEKIKLLEEENKRLKEIIAELRAKNTTV